MYPVGLMVTAVAVTTVAITEVIAPGTTEKVIKKISENVIPKVEPIAVPVSNTVPKADCEELCIPEHPTASVCDEFKRRAQKLKNAEEARKMYDSNCFDGGDNGHIEQSEEIGKGAERCWNLYKECRKKLL